MKIIGFFAFLIAVINYEINGAETDQDLNGAPNFVDVDFTDYSEDLVFTKRRNGNLANNFQRLEITKQTIEKNDNTSDETTALPITALTMIPNGTITSLGVDSVHNIVKPILNRIETLTPNANEFITTKVTSTPYDVAALRSVLMRFDKNAETDKTFSRSKREAETSAATSAEEDKDSIFVRKNPGAKAFLTANRKAFLSVKGLNSRDSEFTFRRHEKLQEEAAKKLKHANDIKVEEILNFIEHNYISMDYIYEEVMRIKKQGQVYDNLRLLVQYLEEERNEKLKKDFLNCYYERMKIDTPIIIDIKESQN